MKIDKENDGVAFNDSTHVYWDINNPKKEYISVTTLIGSYAQPFDSDFWSKYKALEKILDTDVWKDLKKTLLNTHRITKEILEAYSVDINDLNKEQQNILDAWDKKKIESCERGTKIHSQLEHSFYNMKNDKPLQKFGIGGKFICKEGYTKLDLENGVYPEYLISWSTPDNVLNLAGQIDLMISLQLVGCPRPQPLRLRLFDVGVGEVLLEPAVAALAAGHAGNTAREGGRRQPGRPVCGP